LVDDGNDFYIRENLARVRENIANAAVQAGRSPEEITLIGVSKLQPPEAAMAAFRAGLTHFGENRTQELLAKIERLREAGMSPHWHMIGTLQRRKVREILGKTTLIHSVDREDLIDEIAVRSESAGIITRILLEVNASGEASKHGFAPEDTHRLMERISRTSGIQVCGLMTMAPFTTDQAVLESVFSRMQELFLVMQSQGAGEYFRILSMGMSNDYPVAIRHGATHVRIGTAIFAPK
jgi:PLP dependent protein